MRTFDIASLAGPTDWSGPTFSGFGNAAVKLRWINTPFRWHRNSGRELFLVLDGKVDMHVRSGTADEAEILRLEPGQMIVIDEGEEHVADPRAEARILVVEEEAGE